MAELKNNMVPVAIDSLDENSSGTYLLGDSKVVYINFFRHNGVGMVSVKELYDLCYDPKCKVPKALRPMDVAKIFRLLTPEFREAPNGYRATVTFNPGKYSNHEALAVIRTLHVPGGTIEIEEKRFRIDKALGGEYNCPAWILVCMLACYVEEKIWDDTCYEDYLKKIEVTPIPERRPRADRPSMRRVPRPPRQPNPEFWAEHGEPINESGIEMAD